MKIGMNMLLWTNHVSEQHYSIIDELESVHNVRFLRYAFLSGKAGLFLKNSFTSVNSYFWSCANLASELSESDTEFIDRL
jgi:hypothetical protein